MKAIKEELIIGITGRMELYFKDEEGNHYHWGTYSNNAFHDLLSVDEFNVKSFKKLHTFKKDGIERISVQRLAYSINREVK